jgi:hypothetical protein
MIATLLILAQLETVSPALLGFTAPSIFLMTGALKQTKNIHQLCP